MQQTAKEALDKYFETCDILFANAEGAFCFFSSAGGKTMRRRDMIQNKVLIDARTSDCRNALCDTKVQP